MHKKKAQGGNLENYKRRADITHAQRNEKEELKKEKRGEERKGDVHRKRTTRSFLVSSMVMAEHPKHETRETQENTHR